MVGEKRDPARAQVVGDHLPAAGPAAAQRIGEAVELHHHPQVLAHIVGVRVDFGDLQLDHIVAAAHDNALVGGACVQYGQQLQLFVGQNLVDLAVLHLDLPVLAAGAPLDPSPGDGGALAVQHQIQALFHPHSSCSARVPRSPAGGAALGCPPSFTLFGSKWRKYT